MTRREEIARERKRLQENELHRRRPLLIASVVAIMLIAIALIVAASVHGSYSYVPR